MTTTRLEPAPPTSVLDRSWLGGTAVRLLAFVLAEVVVLLAARSSGLPDPASGAGVLLVVLALGPVALAAAVDAHRAPRPGPVLARWALVAVAAGGLLLLWDAGTGLRGLGGVTAVVVLVSAALGCLAGVLAGRRPQV